MKRTMKVWYTEEWDSGFASSSDWCIVNRKTKEVTLPEYAHDLKRVCEHLDMEYITVDGFDYPVFPRSVAPKNHFWYQD